jgi:Zn-dependent protease
MRYGLLTWCLKLGRIRGISIEAHWSFLVLLLVDIARSPSLESFCFALAWFGTILAHELGHCAMAVHFHLRAERIMMWPLGGLAYVSPGRNRFEEIMIAAAGPAVHIPIALLCAAYLHSGGVLLGLADFSPFMTGRGEVYTVFQSLVYQIMQLQIMLLCFNLFLPAYPLDGGRILVAALSRWCSRETTARVALVLTGSIGIWLILRGQLLIGLLLILEAVNLLQADQAGQLRSHPMFAFNPSPIGQRKWSKGADPESKGVLLQFRQRGDLSPFENPAGREGGQTQATVSTLSATRSCPHCNRSIPITAVMCGFCERQI